MVTGVAVHLYILRLNALNSSTGYSKQMKTNIKRINPRLLPKVDMEIIDHKL